MYVEPFSAISTGKEPLLLLSAPLLSLLKDKLNLDC